MTIPLLKSLHVLTFIKIDDSYFGGGMARVLILDFDGTLTDAEAEGLPYRQGYLEDVALLTDVDLEALEWAAQMDMLQVVLVIWMAI